MVIVLVIAKNSKYFWNHVQDRFSKEDIFSVNKTRGHVILKNGDELRYISRESDLRGYHGVKVVMWSVPQWFSFETEMLGRIARSP